MAPVFSRTRSSLPVPPELVVEIAHMLPCSDQRAMVETCWSLHDIVAPVLYRSMDAVVLTGKAETERPATVRARTLRLISMLRTLATSTRHPDGPHGTRRYAQNVLTLAFISFDPVANLRAIPLLAEALRFTRRLTHLRVEMDVDSIPVFLDLCTRKGIIRSPENSLITVAYDEGALTTAILPSLRSIRASKLSILEPLMRFRGIQAAVLDSAHEHTLLAPLLSVLCPARRSCLTHLCISLDGDYSAFDPTVIAMSVAFPRLQYFFVRVTQYSAMDLFTSLISPQYFCDTLALDDHVFPQLREFGFNAGRVVPGCQDTLLGEEDAVVVAGEVRAGLTTVAFGGALWHRENCYGSWRLLSQLPETPWMWMRHRNQAIAGKTLLSVPSFSTCLAYTSRATGPLGPLDLQGSSDTFEVTPHLRARSGSIKLRPAGRRTQRLANRCDDRTLRGACAVKCVVTGAFSHSEPQYSLVAPNTRLNHGHRRISMDVLSPFEIFLLGAPDAVVDTFFARWTPDLIMQLRPLSSSMLSAVEAYGARAWNIENFLGRWFFHVPAFLEILAKCDGVVGGTEAQQFLARGEFRARDLDIYVPWHGALQLGRWLKRRGFCYQPAADKHPLFDAAVLMASAYVAPKPASPSYPCVPRRPSWTTFSFIRPPPGFSTRRDLGTFVQIIAVHGDPVEFMVNKFSSTGSMNYLTSGYAVSLFPSTTFVKRQMVVCQDVRRDPVLHDAWSKKWQSRRFQVLTAADKLPRSPELRAWERKVGDGHTWVLPYNRRHTGSATIPPLVLPNVQFEVLPHHHNVAAAGAMLRIGPRFMYSSMAIMANPFLDLGTFRSLELAAAFAQFYPSEEDTETENAVLEEVVVLPVDKEVLAVGDGVLVGVGGMFGVEDEGLEHRDPGGVATRPTG
ncbi:hypothetical protein OH77DRAFT_1438777 [Trametes cingulata]|nr:hypothetical protein OH77DRAFT_1438777 [Trametes cingulata]